MFQPHTYSRTVALFDAFIEAFKEADRLFFIDIYPARETDDLGMSSAILARAIGERATYCGPHAVAVEHLLAELTPDDLLVIMGAGDVNKVSELLTPYMTNTK